MSAIFGVLPRRGLAGAVLANATNVNTARVLSAGLDFLLGFPLGRSLYEVPPNPPKPARLDEYVGTFASGEGNWFRTRPARNRLRVDFIGVDSNPRTVHLSANGHDEFLIGPRGRDGYLRF